jgi:hypothetical protein
MLFRRASLLLATALFLGGCATPPQAPVNLAGDYFATKPGRVGIATNELPKPDTFFPGAGCLLCLATASIANSELTTHVRTLNTDDLKPLKADLAKLLRAQGLEVVLIDEALKLDTFPDRASPAPNTARKDFSALRDKYKIDRLLLVNVSAVGYTRNYSAYIPNGDARATLQGEGSMVNLSTQALEWHEPLAISRAAESKWDEPPKFPGLTNAYFQALEMAMDQVKKPFIKK